MVVERHSEMQAREKERERETEGGDKVVGEGVAKQLPAVWKLASCHSECVHA